MKDEGVWIHCGELMLEGRLSWGSSVGAVLCHPHPRYGGDMQNNVVMAAREALVALGATVLRFNFRGVGSSHGVCGDGDGEVQDVGAAIHFLSERVGCRPSRIILVGYSFGAWVGLRAVSQGLGVLGCVAIAPPLEIWDLSFAKSLGGRKLLVAGDRDPFCSHGLLRDLMESLQEPKEMVILAGADHFFWGWESRLTWVIQERVGSWIQAVQD